MPSPNGAALSQLEKQVVRLISLGCEQAEMGAILGVGVSVVIAQRRLAKVKKDGPTQPPCAETWHQLSTDTNREADHSCCSRIHSSISASHSEKPMSFNLVNSRTALRRFPDALHARANLCCAASGLSESVTASS